jgi:hypothetical protein
MRPSDEIPFEQSDHADVALMLASVRPWPAEEFAAELDARARKRFATPRAGAAGSAVSRRRRLAPRLGVAAMGLSLAAAAAVVALTGGGLAGGSAPRSPVVRGLPQPLPATGYGGSAPTAKTPVLGAGTTAAHGADTLNTTAGAAVLPGPPVVPGGRQIRSAQIDLTTANRHVNQVASEIIGVVAFEHGTVMNSQITAASAAAGGGYASFTLSIPTANLQSTVNQLSRLRYAALSSSTAGSQNVGGQYASDQRQLADAQALRDSLLKQLAAATTQQQTDSIDAQLKLASGQITRWQRALASLEHHISYSDVTVQVNAGYLPIPPVSHRASVFTLGRAAHDALRVLIVAAGVALIALALAIPVGLALALLIWLWLWSRRRRREQALDRAA